MTELKVLFPLKVVVFWTGFFALPIEDSFRLLHSLSVSDGMRISCIFVIGFGFGLFVPELFDDRVDDFRTLVFHQKRINWKNKTSETLIQIFSRFPALFFDLRGFHLETLFGRLPLFYFRLTSEICSQISLMWLLWTIECSAIAKLLYFRKNQST